MRFGLSSLFRWACPKPEDREKCVIDWAQVAARLERIEREGRDRSKKLDALTEVFAGHIEREERAMGVHIELTTAVNKRMKALLKIFAAEDISSQFYADIDKDDVDGY